MPNCYRSQPHRAIHCISGTLLSLFILSVPAVVLAHGGHGNEFQEGSDTTQATGSIQVDSETAKRLGIKVEKVENQRLAVGIRTTGQIETLPSQRVEVTTPISESQVVDPDNQCP